MGCGLAWGSGLVFYQLCTVLRFYFFLFVLLTKAAEKWLSPALGSSFKSILRGILRICVFTCLLTQIKPTRVSVDRGAAGAGEPAGTL